MTKKELNIGKLVKSCKSASRVLSQLNSEKKNNILQSMANQLIKNEPEIMVANKHDVVSAKERGLSSAMIDRLVLTHQRLVGMADALREVSGLPDPVGQIDSIRSRPNGIQVGQMRIPLGVICIIYESRPNVTSDAAGLCLKAGNAIILRGGSEAFNSNTAISHALSKALESENIPPEAITLVPTTDRAIMNELLTLDEDIDLVIPRGGEGLIRFVNEKSRIPVIKHYKGVCHLYVDKDADLEMAIHLLVDGKTSRPGVCNALETLLVHTDVAKAFLPEANRVLFKKGVELRGCKISQKIVKDISVATEEDYSTEYLDLILSVKVVSDFDEAVSHISTYGSAHTDVIATNNINTAQAFLRQINSSVVAVNASSRFSDGGELGLGAEIGISTTKLHAFGPMGLEALTTKKFVVTGCGQVRHVELLS